MSASDKSLYGLLELSREAGDDAIEAAYRRLVAKLEPIAASGEEAALSRLRAVRDAYKTLSNRALRARYDQQLAVRDSVVRAPVYADEGGSGAGMKIALGVGAIAIVIAAVFGYQNYQSKVERQRAERVLKEKEDALARADADRQRIQDEQAASAAERQRRLDDARYQLWRDQARRDGDAVMRRNEQERARAEAAERREKARAEQAEELERRRQQVAAQRRLEEEKRRLYQLQRENQRY